ncbi:hypothetical protein SELMODRAFT_402448 [Selaginella moellendorffii]|uniref:Uncharacterized protein n=1 Tax=Selaginella moellendorffii TaxID=88036 RepID=D8QQN7_SELML|nr:hypothetical protein SELMODRAFT_402448 [Selaginella moellendorffii]
MRGEQVLWVVVENVELDHLCVGLGHLHQECPELFADELIDLIIDKAPLLKVSVFHMLIGKRRSNTVVRRFLDAEFANDALNSLDQACDQETFTRVLAYPFERRPPLNGKLLDAIDTMKGLGYKREICVFENAILFSPNERLFCEMVKEHPNEAAEPDVYQKTFDKGNMELKHFVGLEAKAKGVKLSIESFFKGIPESDVNRGLALLLEISASPAQAYQIGLNSISSPHIFVSILKKAVEAKVTVNPTSKLIHMLGQVKNDLGDTFVADAIKRDLLKLDDKELAGCFRTPSYSSANWAINQENARLLFKLATTNSCQPFPLLLKEMLRTSFHADSVWLCYVAFRNLMNPDADTCREMAGKLDEYVDPGVYECWLGFLGNGGNMVGCPPASRCLRPSIGKAREFRLRFRPGASIYGGGWIRLIDLAFQNCSVPFALARAIVLFSNGPTSFLVTKCSHSMLPLITFIKDYVNLIASKNPLWNLTRGSDHFFVSCDDWAVYKGHVGHPNWLFRSSICVDSCPADETGNISGICDSVFLGPS